MTDKIIVVDRKYLFTDVDFSIGVKNHFSAYKLLLYIFAPLDFYAPVGQQFFTALSLPHPMPNFNISL